jgi:hypothetical protein
LEGEPGLGDEAIARPGPVGGSTRHRVRRHGLTRLAAMDADALSTTPAARAALEALRAAAGADGPMERHCLRQFAIAERLAGDRAVDRELLLCACWLHDAGLYIPSRDPYVTEGARLADRVLAPFGWPPERLQRCMDACEQHHAPRSRLAMGLEVELVRQADLVDVTAGIVNFGLDRRWVRALFHDVPRDGFWHLLGGAVLGELRHRPGSLTGVFVSPRHTRL